MFEASTIDVLKYGALGLGLVIVVYTAALLKQELARDPPRREARWLILTYMGFGLMAFLGAGYLELAERRATADIDTIKTDLQKTTAQAKTLETDNAKMKAMLDAIANGVRGIDVSIGDKYMVEVRSLPDGAQKQDLIYFTNSICRQVTEIMKAMQPPRSVQCQVQ